MTMKGHAKIELTDVHNGGKEVIESDNIVTNAIQDMLKTYGVYKPAILSDNACMRNFNIPSCFGGLICWDGVIEESKTNYKFKPYGVNAGAHAAYNITNTGTDSMLGSYNSSESEISENHAKFVYDFSTNQGNGDIACITLVNQNNGYVGFGGIDVLKSETTMVPFVSNAFNDMIPLQDENKLIAVDKLLGTSRDAAIKITEYDAFLSGTFSLFSGATPKKVTEVTLSASDLCDYSNPELAEKGYYPIYYDEDTKTVSVVLYNRGATVTELTIAKINVLTREVTRQKVPISNSSTNIIAAHYKNYLLYGYNDSAMSIMDLTTGTVKENTININTPNADRRKQFYPINEHEVLYWHNYAYIDAYPRLILNLKDGTTKSVYSGRYAYQDMSYNFLPYTPLYFSTINNLESPVTKTADKTMKITYTLTEA